MNLFALLKKDNIVRIALSRDVQDDLEKYITKQVDEITKKEVVSFDGQYKPDDNQVLQIEKFEISFKNKLSIDCEILSKESQIDEIKSLIFFFDENKIAFQIFDNRKIIQPNKWNLFLSNKTFSKLNEKGIIIDQKIDVLFNYGNLLFYSYHNASRIFSKLSDYYREVTDKELNEIKESDNIEFEQGVSNEIFNSRIRKKLYLIIRNNTFNKVMQNYEVVKDYASKFGLESYFENNKIIFPKDKEKFKSIINFLNDDLFESAISNEKFETNSKRRIKL